MRKTPADLCRQAAQQTRGKTCSKTCLRTMPQPLSAWYERASSTSSSSSSSTTATTAGEGPKQKKLLRYRTSMASLDAENQAAGEQAEALHKEAGPLTAGLQAVPVIASRNSTNNSSHAWISDNSSHPDDEERQSQFPIGTRVQMVCFSLWFQRFEQFSCISVRVQTTVTTLSV